MFKDYKLLDYLNLAHNEISKIDVNAFNNCSNLHALWMEWNQLNANEESLPINVFVPLVNLQSVRLYGMKIKTSNIKFITNEICKNLLSLKELEMDASDPFHLSEKCTNLWQLRRVILYVRERTQFKNSTLTALRGLPIETFQLRGTGSAGYYKPIEADFLRPLQSLTTLQIYDLHVCYISYLLRTIIYPLQNKTVDLLFDNYLDTPIQSLTNNDLIYIKNICVKKLVLTRVYIQSIDFDTLVNSTLWNCLEEFDASGNYFIDFNFYFFSFTFPHLRKLNLCCQFLSQGPLHGTRNSFLFHRETESSAKLLEVQVFFPDSLREISFDENDLHSHKYDIDLIIHARNVETFSLRNFHFQNCVGTFKGLPNLKVLQITGWNCADISRDFITNLTSVRELTFSSVHLGHNAKNIASLLTNWTHLQYIDLSDNLIDDLHPNFFSSQIFSLQNISLTQNMLKSIPTAVLSLRRLRHVDLRQNLISSLTIEEMEFVENSGDLTIHLGGNDLQCTCNTLLFLSWLERNTQRVSDFDILKCLDEDNVKRDLPDMIKEMKAKELKCVSETALYFAVFGTIFLLLCISLIFTLVKFQADVQYVFARIRRHFRSRKERMKCDQKFHAFVSYGNANYQWTALELKPKLESEGFRLMLPDFHFEPGADYIDNVMNAIDNSRRFIFVITRDFLTDEWCEYHIQVARSHALRKESDNFIIVIVRDGIPLHEIPKPLQRIWIRVKCLRWPIDGDEEAVCQFWETLKKDLMEE